MSRRRQRGAPSSPKAAPDGLGAESVGEAVQEPTSRLISLRLPTAMLEELRRHAARRAMPYQSLLKHWLAERLDEEAARLERQAAELAAIRQGGRAG